MCYIQQGVCNIHLQWWLYPGGNIPWPHHPTNKTTKHSDKVVEKYIVFILQIVFFCFVIDFANIRVCVWFWLIGYYFVCPLCLAVDEDLLSTTSEIDLMYNQGLQRTEWFMGALTALVVVLFLVFAITICYLAKRQTPQDKKLDDEVAIIR